LNHLIEGSFIPLEIIYEHRNYLPSMLFFVPVSLVVINVYDRFKERRIVRCAVAVLLVGMIMVQGMTTFLQNGIWKNEITLWTDNVKRAPKLHRPHHNLGVSLMSAGIFEEGVRELKIALVTKNDATANQKYVTHYHLGRYYFFFKDYSKATWHFQHTLQWAPLYPEPYHYLAKIMCIKGLLKEGETLVNKALALKNEPNFLITYGLIRLQTGDAAGAIEAANRALNRAHNNERAHALLALAYRLKNDDKAAAYHDQAAKGSSVSCTQLK
jgi:tetratricopeptide (TPR) repeat protein